MMDELIVKKNPKSSIAEAIRVVRTNIQFSLKLKNTKTVLITSSIQGEGKSFISSNLAVSYAQKDLKVLLVDCDLRLGRLHKIFKVSNSKGFSNLLVNNDAKNYEKYVKNTKIDNLSFISRGSVPPNPSELLDSKNAQDFIDIVSKDFDIVIFDGTPINGLTDSLVFTKYVEKVVIVSSANYTRMNYLENTIKSLKALKVDIAGIILNKVPIKNNSSYYGGYYGGYYGSGGYTED